LIAELERTPSGAYLRQACFLWEHANNATLDDAPPPSGAVTPLFDPDRYVTGPVQRNARWRVDFNGLGSIDYCATVERTDAVRAGIDADLPGRANHYASGRLSRFLFHHALCRAGALQDGLILPVSVAMKKHEAEYLKTLQEFSRPVRERWRVEWFDEGKYAFDYRGDPVHGIYRYWDATEAVEFSFRMAEKVSKRRRDQFRPRVPEAAFEFVEEVTIKALKSNQ